MLNDKYNSLLKTAAFLRLNKNIIQAKKEKGKKKK
jgi:hypothetical protein